MSWGGLKLVVFDEVHHVLKQHPYRALAASLLDSNAQPRVLGLSASLTYAVGAKKVDAALHQLCRCGVTSKQQLCRCAGVQMFR